jgi:hypothetical protein
LFVAVIALVPLTGFCRLLTRELKKKGFLLEAGIVTIEIE